MSVQAISWALGVSTGDSSAKCLLLALANYADDEGQCWPSQERLAADTEMTDRTVRTKLRALEEAGLISRQSRRSNTGWRSSDLYQLHLVDQTDCPKERNQPENLSGRNEAPTGNPCTANRKTVSGINEPSEEPSSTVAKATVRELKTKLVWQACPAKLVDLGIADQRARKLIGQWLSDAGPDPDRVLDVIDAAYRAGTRDPIAYVVAGLKARRNGRVYTITPGTEQFTRWKQDADRRGDHDLYWKLQRAEREQTEVHVPTRWPERAA